VRLCQQLLSVVHSTVTSTFRISDFTACQQDGTRFCWCRSQV